MKRKVTRTTKPSYHKWFRIVVMMRMDGTRTILAPAVKTAVLTRLRKKRTTPDRFCDEVGCALCFSGTAATVPEKRIGFTGSVRRSKADAAPPQYFPHGLAGHLELGSNHRNRHSALVQRNSAIEPSGSCCMRTRQSPCKILQ